MEDEFTDLIIEIPKFMPVDARRDCIRTIVAQRELYMGGDPQYSNGLEVDHPGNWAPWLNWSPGFLIDLRETWIMDVTRHILTYGGNQWLLNRADTETFHHDFKTAARMEEVAGVSGLARSLFTSVVRLKWIHPLYKAYLYALAWPEKEREFPHRDQVTLSTGHVVSVFCVREQEDDW